MQKKKKNIVILAALGASNLGDELIVASEVSLLQGIFGNDAHMTVCTYNPSQALLKYSEKVQYISYFPNQIRRRICANIIFLFQNILTLLKADVVVIGGGGIFFDNEKGVSFSAVVWQWFFRSCIARLGGAHICWFGISLEIGKSENMKLLKKVFSKHDTYIVRDERSQYLLSSLGLTAQVFPDIAFSDYPLKKYYDTNLSRKVGISLRGGFLQDDNLPKQLYHFLENQGYEPVFLIFSDSGDVHQNDRIFLESILGNNHGYHMTRDIYHTYEIFPQLHAVVGMRFHMIVLAALAHIPCIPFSYGPKTDELIRMLEIGKFSLSAEDVSINQFQKIWQKLDTEYFQIQEHLNRKASLFSKRLLNITESIKKNL